ncbi:MAG TPA: hypothetical protein VM580_11325, partial [Labilithrix sp.]|nr:hypothetical protein [Labilithrix sp.]
MSLSTILAARAARTAGDEPFAPSLFRASSPEDRAALEKLLESGEVHFVYDTLLSQLEELVASRSANRTLTGAELGAAVTAHLAGTPIDEYGIWVFYPWSGRLVR